MLMSRRPALEGNSLVYTFFSFLFCCGSIRSRELGSSLFLLALPSTLSKFSYTFHGISMSSTR